MLWKYAANLQQSNFIEITVWHGCFPVTLLHIFITSRTSLEGCSERQIFTQLVPIEKTWRSQNFDFRNLKICLQVSFSRAPIDSTDIIIEFYHFLLEFKNQKSSSKIVWGFFLIYVSFLRCFILNKIIVPCFFVTKL